jgi:hypothetical protein
VPLQYRDNVWVSRDTDGNYNIYFGGVGKPDGDGHGHYVMTTFGEVTYRRERDSEHGAQNFTDREERGGAKRVGRLAKGVFLAGLAVHGAYAQPQQASGTTQHNWVGSSAQAEADRRARDARGGTRDKGVRDRGSSESE